MVSERPANLWPLSHLQLASLLALSFHFFCVCVLLCIYIYIYISLLLLLFLFCLLFEILLVLLLLFSFSFSVDCGLCVYMFYICVMFVNESVLVKMLGGVSVLVR